MYPILFFLLVSIDFADRPVIPTLFKILWIERSWKSIKYNYVYLNPADEGLELFEGVQDHIAYYNDKTHQTTKQKPNVR